MERASKAIDLFYLSVDELEFHCYFCQYLSNIQDTLVSGDLGIAL